MIEIMSCALLRAYRSKRFAELRDPQNMKPVAILTLLAGLLAAGPLAWGQQPPRPMDHMHHDAQQGRPVQAQPAQIPREMQPGGLPPDTRELVRFPAPLREHTLASMRDHLLTLQRIQEALAAGRYDDAARLAEQRLGLSSFGLHEAHEVAQYMPKGMQEAGNAMHRAASRFAVAAQSAGATGDVRPALSTLSQVTLACVSCHAGYRLR
ncbi:MAG TPA: hypothetical protein VE224_10525 [Pseudolabrys sp.]|nr:hypothetical protein [Pseudolabrys sp.]